MKALLLAAATMAAVSCASEPAAAVRVPAHKLSGEGSSGHAYRPGPPTASDERPPSPGSTTTSTEPETTTTAAPEPTTTEAPYVAPVTTRATTTTVRPTQLAPVVHGDDFWYRLAMCESGAGASSPNIFQFMGGTAAKVGYYAGASYDEQRAMAIDWASRIHPNEGSTAGWPVCWWTAGGS